MSDFLVDVHGLRTFRVSDDGQLLPVIALDDSWRGGVCVAACRRKADHRAPVEGCRCGIYSFRDLTVLRSQYEQADQIVAVVALEGQTLAGSRGWRSQAARVLALWVAPGALPDDLLCTLLANLDDVAFFADVTEMIAGYPDLALRGARPAVVNRSLRPTATRSVTLGRVPAYLLLTGLFLFAFVRGPSSPGSLWSGVGAVGEWIGQNIEDIFFPLLLLGLWVRLRRIRGVAATVVSAVLRVFIPMCVAVVLAAVFRPETLGASWVFAGYAIFIGWLELWQFAVAAGRTDGFGGLLARRFLFLGRKAWRVLRPSRRRTGVNFQPHTRHRISGYPLVMPVHFESPPR